MAERYDRTSDATTYFGLSTEEKPTEDVENCTIFYEVDTQKMYIYYEGSWYEQ